MLIPLADNSGIRRSITLKLTYWHPQCGQMNAAYFADQKTFSADVKDYEKWIHFSISVALETSLCNFHSHSVKKSWKPAKISEKLTILNF